MNTPMNEELVSQTLIQTLEDAAFIFAEPTPCAPDWESARVEVAMGFSGPGSGGRLVLTASRDFAAKLTANLLGVDPSEEGVQEKADGALSELLNIYLGSLVVELYGAEVVCELGLPLSRTLEAEEPEDTQGLACCAFSLLTDEGDRIDARAYTA